jgi:phosphinothricin acetyltransferase
VGRDLNALVRPVTVADLDAVAAIFAWYVEHTVTTFEETPRPVREWDELRVLLSDLGLPFLVAESDDGIAGYAYASPWRRKSGYRHTVENSVFVAHHLTGQGIGRLLLTELLSSCSASGARQVIAVIADSDDPASAALHAALGFTEAGRLAQVGYKHGRSIDTLLMQRWLPQQPRSPAQVECVADSASWAGVADSASWAGSSCAGFSSTGFRTALGLSPGCSR